MAITKEACRVLVMYIRKLVSTNLLLFLVCAEPPALVAGTGQMDCISTGGDGQ